MKGTIHTYIPVATLYFEDNQFFVATQHCPRLNNLKNATDPKKIEAYFNEMNIIYWNGLVYCCSVNRNEAKLCPRFISSTQAFIICNYE